MRSGVVIVAMSVRSFRARGSTTSSGAMIARLVGRRPAEALAQPPRRCSARAVTSSAIPRNKGWRPLRPPDLGAADPAGADWGRLAIPGRPGAGLLKMALVRTRTLDIMADCMGRAFQAA